MSGIGSRDSLPSLMALQQSIISSDTGIDVPSIERQRELLLILQDEARIIQSQIEECKANESSSSSSDLCSQQVTGPNAEDIDLARRIIEQIKAMEELHKIRQTGLSALDPRSASELRASTGMKLIFDPDMHVMWVFSPKEAGIQLRLSMFFRRMCSSQARAASLLGGDGYVLDADRVANNLAIRAYSNLSGLLGNKETSDWPSAMDFDFVSSLGVMADVSSFDSFLRGHMHQLGFYCIRGSVLDRNSMESVRTAMRQLDRDWCTHFGMHWSRCLEGVESFFDTQEGSFTVDFLVSRFDAAFALFHQLAREAYTQTDDSYPADLKTPANVVVLFKAVFVKMQSTVRHDAFQRYSRDFSVCPANRPGGVFGLPSGKRPKLASAHDDLYCVNWLFTQLSVPGGKICSKNPCGRSHALLVEMSRSVAHASILNLNDSAAKVALKTAIDVQVSP